MQQLLTNFRILVLFGSILLRLFSVSLGKSQPSLCLRVIRVLVSLIARPGSFNLLFIHVKFMPLWFNDVARATLHLFLQEHTMLKLHSHEEGRTCEGLASSKSISSAPLSSALESFSIPPRLKHDHSAGTPHTNEAAHVLTNHSCRPCLHSSIHLGRLGSPVGGVALYPVGMTPFTSKAQARVRLG